MNATYRADIDGLRAIAVLSVVFFHVGISPFSGGFVGVDVFFVISGYLITGIIVADLRAGQFSFSRFYTRRARRLFPALFVTLVATFVAGSFILLPSDLEALARTTIAAILSVSNFLFWAESGYFDIDAIQKPLLHTWSLAVEEQYYLIWPLCLFLLFRVRGAKFAFPIVVGIFLASLAVSEYQLSTDPSAAFFLIPARACELALGAAIVWLQRYRPVSNAVREIAVLFGVGLIATAVFSYTDKTPFPGFHAMLPAVGSALIIFAGPSRVLSRLLDNPIMVGVGLISYSLYLVHWPIIVLYTYATPHVLQAQEKWTLVAVSLFAAIGSYFLVEKPFRRSGSRLAAWTPRGALVGCGGLASILAIVSVTAWSSGGWPNRLPNDLKIIAQSIATARQDRAKAMTCVIAGDCTDTPHKGKILIIGDSFAQGYSIGLSRVYPELGIERLVTSECKLLIGYDDPKIRNNPLGRTRCDEQKKRLLQADLGSYDAVVLAMWWQPVHAPALHRTVAELAKKTSHLIVFGPRMTLSLNVVRIAQVAADRDDFARRVNGKLAYAKYAQTRDAMKAGLNEPNVTFVDVGEIQGGKKISGLTADGQSVYFDTGHFTQSASIEFAAKLRSAIPHLFSITSEPDSIADVIAD